MNRYFCRLAFVLLLAPSLSSAQQSLVGTYKLTSFVLEVDGTPSQGTVGPDPHGYLIITPTHLLLAYTGKNRKFGTSVEEKAALWETLGFYGGPYQVQGDKLIMSVDLSWNQSWTGTKQTRTFKSDANRLTIASAPIPFPRDPSKTVVSRLIWEKVE